MLYRMFCSSKTPSDLINVRTLRPAAMGFDALPPLKLAIIILTYEAIAVPRKLTRIERLIRRFRCVAGKIFQNYFARASRNPYPE